MTARRFAVLVVDDSSAMRKNVIDILAHMQRFTWVEACDGIDALVKLHQQQFDLVVSDINMPRMDGLKLTEAVRRHLRHGHTPIIIMTSEEGALNKMRAMALGANVYLIKPADGVALQDAIAQVLPAH